MGEVILVDFVVTETHMQRYTVDVTNTHTQFRAKLLSIELKLSHEMHTTK